MRFSQIAQRAFRGLVTSLRLGRPAVFSHDGEDALHPHRRRHLDLIEFMLAVDLDKRVRMLDVGCGFGSLALRLRRTGFEHVEGVDFLDPREIPAEALDSMERYVQADLNSSGLAHFASESFDVVVSSDVIEHIESPAFLLREIARVLVPGGTIFLTYPNAFNMFERLVMLASGNSTRYRIEAPGSYGHISMLPQHVLVSLATRAGLRIEHEGRGYCMFANTMIMPTRNFGPAWSFVRYVHLVKPARVVHPLAAAGQQAEGETVNQSAFALSEQQNVGGGPVQGQP